MAENLLIVHGGGPTAVMNASLYGAIEEAKRSGKIQHIYGADNGTGGFLAERFIELEDVPEEKHPGTLLNRKITKKWRIFWKPGT